MYFWFVRSKIQLIEFTVRWIGELVRCPREEGGSVTLLAQFALILGIEFFLFVEDVTN
jgi:hypothetical protein